MVTNGGNVSLLSSTLLKPYQMALIQELHKTNLKMDLSTKSVSLREALSSLKTTSSLKSENLISMKIDRFLLKIQGITVDQLPKFDDNPQKNESEIPATINNSAGDTKQNSKGSL